MKVNDRHASAMPGGFLVSLKSAATPVNLLVLLNLAITIPLAYILSLGLDETFTLDTTAHGVRYAVKQAIYFELQAPLYFVLLSVMRAVSDALFWGRLFSVISIALTLKVAGSLSERLFPRIHPAWIVAVLAIHPYLIWAATEMRLYAFTILLSALLLLLFHDAFLKDQPRPAMQIGYAVVAVAALYTHYYLGFLLVGNAAALLALRRWRMLVVYLLSMMGVAVCFVPMLVLIPYQFSTHTQTLTKVVPILRGAEIVSWYVKEFILPADATPLELLRRWVVRGCYIALVIIAIKRFRQLLTPANIWIAIVFFVAAGCYVALIRITGPSLGQIRHFFVLFVPTVLLVFGLLATLDKRLRVAWFALMLIFCATSLVYVYRPMAKYGNWNQVAGYVMANERAGQPILIFHAGNALTFGHYYRGPNVLVPLPRENRFDTFDIRDYVLRDEAQINDAIMSKAGEQKQVWLVTDGVCGFMDVDYHCQILDDYIAKHYSVESTATFATSTVRLLRRK